MNRSISVFLWLSIGLIFVLTNAQADEPALGDPSTRSTKQSLLDAIEVTRPTDQRPPNIVLIVADDLGYADSGCYGSESIPTPHIDSLSQGGVKFTDAYVSAGTCSPSRAGMLSGCYQNRFGFEFNAAVGTARRKPEVVGLDPSVLTMADVLRQGGYTTSMVGKWHVGFHEHHHPLARGFDEFFGFLSGAHQFLPKEAKATRIVGEEQTGTSNEILRGKESIAESEYLTDAFAREASAFIERDRESPFFLYVPFNAVHTPFQVTDKYEQRFAHISDPTRRVYYAMTAAMDDAIGAILASLKKKGLDDNTLVVFLSDNGGPLYTTVQSNGPLKLGKLFLFEGGIRVPFIMKWPGTLKPGSVYQQPIIALDLFPTFATAAGLTLPKELVLDGVNLLPYLKDEKPGTPHESFCWRNGPNHAVRKGNWKLVQSGTNIWLYDLSKDIGETTNLADKEPDVVAELQATFEAWSRQMKPAAWPNRPGSKPMEVDGVLYQIAI